jgi:hypothetical protein
VKRQIIFRHFLGISRYFILSLLLLPVCFPAFAASLSDVPVSVSEAAAQLVQYCNDSKAGLDEQAVATLVDFVLTSKHNREYSLPKSNESYGAYYEFDTKIGFSRFMDYSYTSLVPSAITRPSSLRYSIWSNPRSDMREMPSRWGAIPANGAPLIIRGLQRDSNTPDLTTGVYHEYELKRTLILLNHKGQQVLISVSKQISESSVGKKGVIVGNDNEWTYFYSNEPGTMKSGIGWAKSYIYDYFSVGVYTESSNSPSMVRTGVFQWLRAGWLGINLVKPAHIVTGMKRYAQNSKIVLESPRLPAPSQLTSAYQTLLNMPSESLVKDMPLCSRHCDLQLCR